MFEISTAGPVQRPIYVIVPNVVPIGQISLLNKQSTDYVQAYKCQESTPLQRTGNLLLNCFTLPSF